MRWVAAGKVGSYGGCPLRISGLTSGSPREVGERREDSPDSGGEALRLIRICDY